MAPPGSLFFCCLNSIHHLGLRLTLGTLRTSPVESLYVEENEAPLSPRREKLALQYYTNRMNIYMHAL